MKLLQNALILATAVTFALSGPKSYGQEMVPSPANSQKLNGLKEVVPANLSNYSNYLTNVAKVQDVTQFRIIDSLANAYSYFTPNQQPFVYYEPTNQLVTIKRGFVDKSVNTTYTGTDTKDNLFLLTSSDIGLTWDRALVYNSDVNSPRLPARYPSVYAFQYEDKMAYVYTAPLTAGTGWNGYMDGFYYDGSIVSTAQAQTVQSNGKTYYWYGTDSKILGGVDGTDPFGIIVGGVLPEGGLPLEENSNLAYRRTTNFTGEWPGVVPPQWTTDKFVTPTSTNDSVRSNSVVNLKYGPDNKMYFGIWGNFAADEDPNHGEVGYSVSSDLGKTWGDFVMMPSSVIKAYATQLGINPDSAFISLSSPDFAVMDNGDVSFVFSFYEGLDTNTKPYNEQVHQLIEIYRENNAWGVRKISDISGLVLAYIGATTNNQMGSEAQISRTFDGNTLVCKWVDFFQFTDDQGNPAGSSTDIVFSKRAKGTTSWSAPLDVTKSLIYDRITWIPDILPNDLTKVPVLKVESIPNPADNDQEAADRQRSLETQAQYVLVGNADITVSGVNDEPAQIASLSIDQVYPNPADKNIELSFTLPVSSNASVDLFNAMGQKVMNAWEGQASDGLHAININTSNLPTGMYYCTLVCNGQRVTKSINVIH